MVMTGSILGLNPSELVEAIQTFHLGKDKVFVDIGDGTLRLVETIKSGKVDGEQVVVLRALL